MGLDLLLQGLASIPAGERPHAAIAGSGPEREALAALVRDLGLDDDVTFLGRVPDDQLATLYAAGTISVVPTRQLEGFGYVVLESYAAGTPVLATSVGGLVDVVGSFDPDRLVDPTPEGLATGIRAALSDPQRLPSREACRAFAAQFAWDHVAPRVEAVFVEAATS